jgi:hypothetical protein
MVGRNELLQSIAQDMKLDKNFLLRIYGLEISYPGFARRALDKLAAVGCSRAQEYYNQCVSVYEAERAAGLKAAGKEYRAKLEKIWAEKGLKRERSKRNEYQFAGFPTDW